MDIELVKADERGLATMVVYRADAPGADKQGDVIGAQDLWLGMANWGGSRHRQLKLQHADNVPAGAVVCVGSMMTGDRPYRGDGYTVPAKTWAVTLKFDLDSDDGRKLFDDLKAKRLGGLSIGGTASVGEYLSGGER